MPKSRTGTTAKNNVFKIKVSFGPGLRQKPCGGLSAALMEQAAAVFLACHGMTSATLSLVFVTGPVMRKMNKVHLGHDYVTDILTFDLGPQKPGTIDGELVMCPAEARRNARMFGAPLEEEILRYVAHGILHLLGYDDATERQRAVMRREENKLLASIWP
jgi:rRNA maturation RNase YbeY